MIRLDRNAARFGLPGLLLGIALGWGVRAREVFAQNPPLDGAPRSARTQSRPAEGTRSQAARPISGGDGSGTLSMTSAAPGGGQLLYLIDTRKQAFAVYRIDPANPKGTVKLEGSRQYRWDLELEHYNNQAPEPDAIRTTVKTLAHSLP